MSNDIHSLLRKADSMLCALYHPDEAISIAWELIIFVMQQPKLALLTRNISISDAQCLQVEKLLYEHIYKSIPLAYLTQRVAFGLLDLAIRPPILIPRPETEEWCYKLITMLTVLHNVPLRILDLCTGSGCIALALAKAFPSASVTGVDVSPEAITLARENSIRNNITNCVWIQSDLFDNLGMQQFDIIVSNPPYISYAEWIHLDPSVRDYESPRALIADNEGYAIIESIIKNASMYIMQNNLLSLYKIPQLYMEIGYNQAKNVETFLRVHGYVNIELWQDYNGHTRVVCGRVSNAVHSRDS